MPWKDWIDRALAVAALTGTSLVACSALAQAPGDFSTLTTAGTATFNGEVLICSGQPWVDVRCPGMAGGAVGDGSHDDTAAIQAAIDAGVANNWPVHLSGGTYKVTSMLTIDYAGQASRGFRLISRGATIDGRAIAAGPVLRVHCSGGVPGAPADCFYFKQEGLLFVFADTPDYAVVIGKDDFSDAQNTIKLDHLNVNNRNTDSAAGGCRFNYVLDSDLWAACVSAGGGGGLALEQTQFSRISGSGTARGTGGRGLVLENGFNYANTFLALDLEESPICLSITTPHDGQNTFVSPYFACTTAIDATASKRNLLINPTFAGNVVNRGPQSTGIEVIGNGNWSHWQYPTAATYTAAPIDDRTVLSSFNAPGSVLTVSLPAPGAVRAGWSMGFASDSGKGITVTPASGSILAGGKVLPSLTLGPGNYEYAELVSDGSQYRLTSATRNTRTANGVESRDWPGNWLYPASAGYAATLADNGTVLSSFNTVDGLTVTLPSTAGLPSGWSIGFTTDNGKGLTVRVNDTSGGQILYPKSQAAGVTSLLLADNRFEFVMLQYDGSGNFRVMQATPATAQTIGMAGPGGIGRWLFPAESAYAAKLDDNGAAVSSFNSPASFMTVTLPPVGMISAGWTIAVASDNNKSTSVQVDGGGGEKILVPDTLGAQNALSLSGSASGYELVTLQFDGSNFRIISATPLSANAAGMSVPIGTPTSSLAACQTGALQSDGLYLYFCSAPNTWKRAALSSF
ncbi:MAG TPA: glycosyl hydrolase family 28-related protein [Stellaceae bacterium]|nr:glycosyl hydrolase family 28-related protein [Stellaceae bacterium]